jgi:hypothetical protein
LACGACGLAFRGRAELTRHLRERHGLSGGGGAEPPPPSGRLVSFADLISMAAARGSRSRHPLDPRVAEPASVRRSASRSLAAYKERGSMAGVRGTLKVRRCGMQTVADSRKAPPLGSGRPPVAGLCPTPTTMGMAELARGQGNR